MAEGITLRLRTVRSEKPERTMAVFKRAGMPIAIEICSGKESRTINADDPKGLAKKVLGIHAELAREGVSLVIELPERVEEDKRRPYSAPLGGEEMGIFIRAIVRPDEEKAPPLEPVS